MSAYTEAARVIALRAEVAAQIEAAERLLREHRDEMARPWAYPVPARG